MQQPEIVNKEVLCINLVNGDICRKNTIDFNSFDLEIKKSPKKSCKKCYGRGWLGTYKTLDNDELNGLKVICSCVFRKDFSA